MYEAASLFSSCGRKPFFLNVENSEAAVRDSLKMVFGMPSLHVATSRK